MFTLKEATGIVLIVTVAVLIAYDIWARVVIGEPWTISAIVLQVSLRYPIVPFAAGLLCGHLFAPQNFRP